MKPIKPSTGRIIPILLIAACSPVGNAPPPPGAPLPESPPGAADVVEAPPINGEYSGNLAIDEDLFPTHLTISGEFARPEIMLHMDDGLIRAEGFGMYENGVLVADLPYGNSDCLGTLNLNGRLIENGAWLSGRFYAEDCTGVIEGRFSFQQGSGS